MKSDLRRREAIRYAKKVLAEVMAEAIDRMKVDEGSSGYPPFYVKSVTDLPTFPGCVQIDCRVSHDQFDDEPVMLEVRMAEIT